MVGDDPIGSNSKTTKAKQGRAATRKEASRDMPSIQTETDSSHDSRSKNHGVAMSVRDQMLSEEYENSKRFRSSLLDIGELEFQLSCLSRKVEQANHMVMEFRHFLLSKPDIFDNPEKYKDWYPYQEYKKHSSIRDAAMEELDLVMAQMLEARKSRKSAMSFNNESSRVPDHVDLTSNHVDLTSNNSADDLISNNED
jgi:hypothetical protein